MHQSDHAQAMADRFRELLEESGDSITESHYDELKLIIEAGLDTALVEAMTKIAGELSRMAENIQTKAEKKDRKREEEGEYSRQDARLAKRLDWMFHHQDMRIPLRPPRLCEKYKVEGCAVRTTPLALTSWRCARRTLQLNQCLQITRITTCA